MNLSGREPVPMRVSEDGRTVEIEQVAAESRAYGFSWVDRDHGFSFTSPSHYLQVALGSSPAGAYLLAVRITDRSTGIESLPAVTPLYRPVATDAHWIDAPRRRSTIVNP